MSRPARTPPVNKPDVVVVGCGGTGAVVAKELAEMGLGVVVLEAGPWHDPAKEFTGLEWEMLNPFDALFRWGPADRRKPSWPRRTDGLPTIIQSAGVGGNTLHFGANCPRAYVGAVEQGWPLRYRDLVPHFFRVEETLPVLVPEIVAPKDEIFVRGCEASGLPHTPGPDITGVGWRMQPNAILPLATRGAAPDGCVQCGECIIGCRHPMGAPLEQTAKRGTNVTYAPMAVATGRCEIRTGCFATRILVERRTRAEGRRGEMAARGVRYRTDDGREFEQDARAVVLTAGAIESPRLWLASELPDTGAVGRYLTTHWFDYVTGELDREVEMYKGQTSMVRAEFPGYGFVETQGLGPFGFAAVTFLGREPIEDGGPWTTRGRLFGPALKRKMEAYRRSLMLVAIVDDEADAANGVSLMPDATDEHNPVPLVRYHATPVTAERRDWLARRAAEILISAGARPETIHRADAHPSSVHMMGTMRMGTDPGSSVVDTGCEAHLVERLFVADTSVFPNGIGGPNPTLTAQAVATRAAGIIAERYFT